MKPIGGSEILYNNLVKYTGLDWSQRINLILSVCDRNVIDPRRVNVLWQHLMTDQNAVMGMNQLDFVQSIDHFVYVSNWQLTQFTDNFSAELCQNHIIRNAIDPIEFKPRASGPIRLIYTSTPNRGLVVLLRSLEILNRKDIELVVYSSNIIYGKSYSDQLAGQYDQLFHRCRTTTGITYKGFAVNKAIRTALQSAHILAYPSIYEETSCLAAIEAGAAGCRIVTTNLGALPETCDQWASYVDYSYGDDLEALAEKYAAALAHEIDQYWTNSYNLQSQSDWFNARYSWQTRKLEWLNFFNKICAK